MVEGSRTLKVSNLTIERGHKIVVRNFNLVAAPGDLIQIVGKNGSGKTSILRAISGLMPLFEGSVEWEAKSILSLESYYKVVNYLGHSPGLSPELTGYENLDLYKTISGARKLAMDLPEAISMCGAQNIASKPIKSLSAGEKQKMVLARLLMFKCPLWVLDEPFNTLDAKTQEILENRIDNHILNGGAVVLTSHQSFSTTCPRHSIVI